MVEDVYLDCYGNQDDSSSYDDLFRDFIHGNDMVNKIFKIFYSFVQLLFSAAITAILLTIVFRIVYELVMYIWTFPI